MRHRRGRPRPLAAAAGLALDRLLPELPGAVHPVVLFGTVMTGLERRIHRDAKGPGLLHALVGVSLGLGVGRRGALDRFGDIVGRGRACPGRDGGRRRVLTPGGRRGTGVGVAAVAGRAGPERAGQERDRPGRGGVRGGEHGGRGRGAGLLGFGGRRSGRARLSLRQHPRFHGGPPLPALCQLRLGERAPRRCAGVGTRPPDRLLLVAAVRPRTARAVWVAVRDQAPAHPSPNVGVAEAAFAAAWGCVSGVPTATVTGSRSGWRWEPDGRQRWRTSVPPSASRTTSAVPSLSAWR